MLLKHKTPAPCHATVSYILLFSSCRRATAILIHGAPALRQAWCCVPLVHGLIWSSTDLAKPLRTVLKARPLGRTSMQTPSQVTNLIIPSPPATEKATVDGLGRQNTGDGGAKAPVWGRPSRLPRLENLMICNRGNQLRRVTKVLIC